MKEKDHFYTYCVLNKKFIKKSNIPNFLLFLEYIEKTLSEFPKEEGDLKIIKNVLSNIYRLFAIPKESEEILKYVVYLEEKAHELEKIGKTMVKDFIDFAEIDNDKIRKLNNLRVNIRILENLFWIAIKEIKINDGLLLVIPHFLNVASKYIFYYIVVNYKDDLKYIERNLGNIEYNENLYKEYLEKYKNKNLKEYL
ncbi:MAG: hypothetical protein QW038_01550 [Nanopusillaceae archaeon]